MTPHVQAKHAASILPRAMRPRAGPAPIRRLPRHPSPHRVVLQIPQKHLESRANQVHRVKTRRPIYGSRSPVGRVHLTSPPSIQRREPVTCIGIVRVNGQPEELDGLDGRRQPSMGGTSRVSREAQARFCERLGVKFPRAYSAAVSDDAPLPRPSGLSLRSLPPRRFQCPTRHSRWPVFR